MRNKLKRLLVFALINLAVALVIAGIILAIADIYIKNVILSGT